jgi:hypothetical protein
MDVINDIVCGNRFAVFSSLFIDNSSIYMYLFAFAQ